MRKKYRYLVFFIATTQQGETNYQRAVITSNQLLKTFPEDLDQIEGDLTRQHHLMECLLTGLHLVEVIPESAPPDDDFDKMRANYSQTKKVSAPTKKRWWELVLPFFGRFWK